MVHAYSHFQALAGGIDDGLPDLSRVSPLVIEEGCESFRRPGQS